MRGVGIWWKIKKGGSLLAKDLNKEKKDYKKILILLSNILYIIAIVGGITFAILAMIYTDKPFGIINNYLIYNQIPPIIFLLVFISSTIKYIIEKIEKYKSKDIK